MSWLHSYLVELVYASVFAGRLGSVDSTNRPGQFGVELTIFPKTWTPTTCNFPKSGPCTKVGWHT
ncbi:hypothetical protein PR003_g12633 [Phytophthora rubi]|uniref:Secreted protein n=1 Tax=Phytophthora rubi TaxID=129364 RepID=A0A6A4FHS5_9STRA|nr:hypothetical protein PR002_g29338 [Phytophthora rubi]KAE9034873.1 hypothetical protein PR001_g9557 [Phytophthora rubi]KAE9336194.1 hypothetical protein PR003_g12633 [Phytophthora rubi]